MLKIIRCYNCDSEYQVEYDVGLIADDLQYCMICQEPVEPEDVIESEC